VVAETERGFVGRRRVRHRFTAGVAPCQALLTTEGKVMFKRSEKERVVSEEDVVRLAQKEFRTAMRLRVLLDSFGSGIEWVGNYEMQSIDSFYVAHGVKILFRDIDALSCGELHDKYGEELKDKIRKDARQREEEVERIIERIG